MIVSIGNISKIVFAWSLTLTNNDVLAQFRITCISTFISGFSLVKPHVSHLSLLKISIQIYLN